MPNIHVDLYKIIDVNITCRNKYKNNVHMMVGIDLSVLYTSVI